MEGGRRSAQTRIAVSIPPEVENLFVVFFSPGRDMPTFKDLKTWLTGKLRGFFNEPLLSSVTEYCQTDLRVSLRKRADLPPLPVSVLRYTGLDEIEERKLEQSLLALVIEAQTDNRPPRVGLWSALGIGCAAAEQLGGTLFDPAASRIIPLGRVQRPLSTDGAIAAARHIVVPFSIGERGLGWMTTTGLAKFGLPELEIVDVPPGLGELGRLMNATAQHLVDLVDRARSGQGTAAVVDIPDELQIEFADHEKASGRQSTEDRSIRVGLQLADGPQDKPGFVRVVEPEGVRGSHGEWLFLAMDQLFGSKGELRNVKTSSAEMQAAHRRAISELGRARDRFVRGLRPGETLYVKSGFAAGARGKEYMWVAITSWSDRLLRGQLVNNARDSGLRAGLDVELDEADVFDWMIQLPHGEHEGGYTTEVALKYGHEHSELGP